MLLRLAFRLAIPILVAVPVQAQSAGRLSSTAGATEAAQDQAVAGLAHKLNLRLEPGATPSNLRLVISGGRAGSPVFLLARTAGTAGPESLGRVERIEPDIVLPLGNFDARGGAAVKVGDLARTLHQSTVWVQAASHGGTSRPLGLSAALVTAMLRISAPAPGAWCHTHRQYLESLRAKVPSFNGNCPELGPCDNPLARNAAIPTPSTPIKTIRLSIHVFCNNNGSNCAATTGEVAISVARLNADFAPWRIQFVYDMNFVNSTKYRDLDNSEVTRMKRAHNSAPATKLNIYVVSTTFGSFGTFPWTANALGQQGGIVINDQGFGNTTFPAVLTHEVGHCLGLWHTFHGVTEVGLCTDCYESAGRTPTVGDTTGDKCSDTYPTTNHGVCADPAGVDACSSNPWTATPYLNYMSYSISCATTFTPQQAGRMHCWTDAILSGWLEVPVGPPAAPSGLAATGISSSRIDLAWTDNANNESGFEIERSPGGAGSWALIASVGANATSFQSTGLAASTSYDFRVRAVNTGGASAFSPPANAMTDPPPQPGDATADQDIAGSGTVSGSYSDTHASDDGYESITERESGGKPSNRHSYLEHKWTIAVLGGASSTFHVEAFKTASSDGDDFVFAWSSDGQNYTDMLHVVKTADDDVEQTFLLPAGLSGTVYIRVQDTDQTAGHRALDTIFIDHMFIRSQ